MNISQHKINKTRVDNARILVVEDNADQRLLVKNALQKSFTGIESVIVNNEHEAIAYIDECTLTGIRLPQLILLDLYLPERENGWHFLKTLRSRNLEESAIPVVIFSNSKSQEDIIESYDRGVTSYVIKPTDFAQWLDYFQTLKDYWWDTASLPNNRSLY